MFLSRPGQGELLGGRGVGAGRMRGGAGIVDAGFGRLALLQTPRDVVDPPLLDKERPRLLEVEGHPLPDALRPNSLHPLIAAGARVRPRLAPAEDVLDPAGGEVGLEVHRPQHRLAADVPVPDRQRQVEGQPGVGHLLIFRRAVDRHIGVAVPPVGRDYDDGKYELDILVGDVKYEYEIGASSGKVLKAERDRRDWDDRYDDDWDDRSTMTGMTATTTIGTTDRS